MELVFTHPWYSALLVLVSEFALGEVLRAVVLPLAPCRRGNCPRCNGTGAEERVRPA